MEFFSLLIVVAFGMALLLLLIAYARDEHELSRLRERTLEEARKQYELWKSAELRADYLKLREEAMREAELTLQKWKTDEEKRIRDDAAQRSSSVKLGKVAEQLVPIALQNILGADLEDFRFLGSPVDYVVFRGLSKGSLAEVLFLEVKSGSVSNLSMREREVKRAIEEKRVGFLTYRLADEKSI